MCVLLSDFLRKTLGLGERESISWAKSWNWRERIWTGEQVRFGALASRDAGGRRLRRLPGASPGTAAADRKRHQTRDCDDGGLGGIVRLESHVENGIWQCARREQFRSRCASPRRHGLGLRNVRSRLQTRFGDAARLDLAAEDDRFRAEMVFPCHKINS